jgi:hypothetical protein
MIKAGIMLAFVCVVAMASIPNRVTRQDKPALYITFKNERIRAEFFDSRTDPRLRYMAMRHARMAWETHHKPLEITCVWRSDNEQRAIYPKQPERRSDHQDRRAYDAKVRGLDNNDCIGIELALNHTFRGMTGYSNISCLYHADSTDTGKHFHCRVPQE